MPQMERARKDNAADGKNPAREDTPKISDLVAGCTMKLGLAHGVARSLGLEPSHCLVRDRRRTRRLGSWPGQSFTG
jgi:hypothetical protein